LPDTAIPTVSPAGERDRIAALRAYGVLYTAPEAAFDDIVGLAARLCETPTAVVGLIAEDEQWFMARVGLDVRTSDRALSFCDHAMRADGVMVLPDAAADPRFADNAMVTGPPYVRFYAGAPLITPDGHPLGALCVIDSKPRPEGLTELQTETMTVLARQVMAQLELRRLRTRALPARLTGDVLTQELRHRIKNIFAVVSALISLSARQHPEARQFAGSLRTRINALARAHEFVRPHVEASAQATGQATLHGFLADLFTPYARPDGSPRVHIGGEDAPFDDQAATSVALLFHELAANAARYGALSTADGYVDLETRRDRDRFILTWREQGGPGLSGPPDQVGFGSALVTLSVEGQLGGRLERTWAPEGLRVVADLPATALSRRQAALNVI
jgi:two-component sensor histidine kinase